MIAEVGEATEVVEGVLKKESPEDSNFETLPDSCSHTSALQTAEDRQLLGQPFLYGPYGCVCEVEPWGVFFLDFCDSLFFEEGIARGGKDVWIDPLVIGTRIRNLLFQCPRVCDAVAV